MKFQNPESQSVAKDSKSIKGGVSHRAMVAALAMPLMLLISPTGGRSARAADDRQFGAGQFQANQQSVRIRGTKAGTGAVTLTGTKATGGSKVTHVSITGAVTTGKNALFANSGAILAFNGEATAVSATASFAGTISNRAVIRATKTGNTDRAARGVKIFKAVNSGPAVLNNSGTIKATVIVTGNGNTAIATGVAAFGTTSKAKITVNNGSKGTISAFASATGATAQNAIANGILVGATSTGASISGAITNAGRIQVTANMPNATAGTVLGVGIRVTGNVSAFTGTIVNSGLITVKASAQAGASAYGVLLDSKLSGNFTNTASATIKVSAVAATSLTAFAAGVLVSPGITGNVVNSGKITVRAAVTSGFNASAYGISARRLNGDFTNNGTLKVTAVASNSAALGSALRIFGTPGMVGTLFNNGLISAKATGSTQAQARAIELRTLVGNLNNASTIKASASATNGKATATGIFIVNKMTGTIVNSGMITAVANGVTSANALAIDVGSKLSGNFTNTGTIVASASAPTGDASARGFNVGVKMTGNIVNSGNITAVATASNVNARGINVSSTLQGNFTNTANATLRASANSGTNANARGFNVGGSMTGTIVNSGLITVKATATSNANARGVNIGGNLSGSISNTQNATVKAFASATGGTANATGFNVSSRMTANLTNNGLIMVTAVGTTSVVTRGINVGSKHSGSFVNGGTVMVKATAAGGTTPVAQARPGSASPG